MKYKLFRYGALAAVLFLLFCGASVAQHWSYLTSQASSYVSKTFNSVIAVIAVMLVLKLLLGLFPGGRRR